MKNKKPIQISILFLAVFTLGVFAFSVEAQAATYYISPSGTNSGNCTFASPCRTISYAAAKLSPGDTLYLRGGTYILPKNGEPFPAGISGTSGNPITIKNYANETPVLTNASGVDGRGSGFMFQNSSSPNNWIVIDGLNFTGIYWINLYLQHVNHMIVKNCNFYDTYGHGAGLIDIGGGDNGNSSYVSIEDNTFINTGEVYSYEHEHVVYVDKGSSFVTVKNNYFKNTRSGGSIHVYGNADPKPHDVDIYNNVFNMLTGYMGRSAIEIYTGGTGIYNVNVYNNTIYLDCNGVNPDTNIGRCRAIDARTNGVNNMVKNNIIYVVNYGNYEDTIIMTSGSQYVTFDNNLYYPSKDSDDTGANSKQVTDGSTIFNNISTGNFTLKIGSPAINAGITTNAPIYDILGTLRSSFGLPDIGAYEYTGSVASSPDVDGSGSVNIKDIQACIKVITNSQPDQNIIDKCKVLAAPDMTTNIKDIQVIVSAIVNHQGYLPREIRRGYFTGVQEIIKKIINP